MVVGYIQQSAWIFFEGPFATPCKEITQVNKVLKKKEQAASQLLIN